LGVISRVKQSFFRLQHAYAVRDVLHRSRDLLKQFPFITEIRYSAGKAVRVARRMTSDPGALHRARK